MMRNQRANLSFPSLSVSTVNNKEAMKKFFILADISEQTGARPLTINHAFFSLSTIRSCRLFLDMNDGTRHEWQSSTSRTAQCDRPCVYARGRIIGRIEAEDRWAANRDIRERVLREDVAVASGLAGVRGLIRSNCAANDFGHERHTGSRSDSQLGFSASRIIRHVIIYFIDRTWANSSLHSVLYPASVCLFMGSYRIRVVEMTSRRAAGLTYRRHYWPVDYYSYSLYKYTRCVIGTGPDGPVPTPTSLNIKR